MVRHAGDTVIPRCCAGLHLSYVCRMLVVLNPERRLECSDQLGDVAVSFIYSCPFNLWDEVRHVL